MVPPAPPSTAGAAAQYSGGVKKTRMHSWGELNGHALHTCPRLCNRICTSGALREDSL